MQNRIWYRIFRLPGIIVECCRFGSLRFWSYDRVRYMFDGVQSSFSPGTTPKPHHRGPPRPRRRSSGQGRETTWLLFCCCCRCRCFCLLFVVCCLLRRDCAAEPSTSAHASTWLNQLDEAEKRKLYTERERERDNQKNIERECKIDRPRDNPKRFLMTASRRRKCRDVAQQRRALGMTSACGTLEQMGNVRRILSGIGSGTSLAMLAWKYNLLRSSCRSSTAK